MSPPVPARREQHAPQPQSDRPFRRTKAAAGGATLAAAAPAGPSSDRPFRFRASDVDAADAAGAAGEAPPSVPSFRVRKSRQVVLQQRTPGGSSPARGPAAAAAEQQVRAAAGGWDPELLARCAANQAYISSEEALQTSPLFVEHVR